MILQATAAAAPKTGKSAYQPHIDGLRTLAVIAVLLFHFELPPFTGGFVGVDVFFVISGYLIIGMITGKVASGTFSLAEFYMRRVRRLMPAILTVLLGVLVAAMLLMSPQDLSKVARDSVWALLSVINFTLAGGGGDYFAADHTANPLLHFWSLAVEEQFYLVFPFIAFAAARFLPKTGAKLLVYGALAVLSFIAAEWLIRAGLQSWAYYMMPARFGELLLGGMLALYQAQNRDRALLRDKAPLGLVIAIAATALIYWSATTLSPASRFPGLNALPATLGTLALLHFGATRFFAPLLSNRLMTYVGRLSYSLYLVHWPVYVFATYYLSRALTPVETGLAIALCFALSAAIYHGVENPMRFGERFKGRGFLRFAAPMAALFVAMAGTAHVTDGLPGRVDADRRAYAGMEDNFARTAFGGSGFSNGVPYHLGDQSTTPSFFLVGDSLARQFGSGLDEELKTRGASVLAISRNGCPMIDPYVRIRRGRPERECNAMQRNTTLLSESFELPIVWITYWDYYPTLEFEDPKGDVVELKNDAYLDQVMLTVDSLIAQTDARDQELIVLSDITPVAARTPIVSCLSRPDLLGLPCRGDVTKPKSQIEPSEYSLLLEDRMRGKAGARFVDIHDLMCDADTCYRVKNDQILLSDVYHLSKDGSRQAAGPLLDRIGLPLTREPHGRPDGYLSDGPVISQITFKERPISEAPFPFPEGAVPIEPVSSGGKVEPFDIYQIGDTIVFRKESCTIANKPFYLTLQWYPVDLSNINKKNEGRKFNNADSKPTYYIDGDSCTVYRPLPRYEIRGFYAGQTEKRAGNQWKVRVNAPQLDQSHTTAAGQTP